MGQRDLPCISMTESAFKVKETPTSHIQAAVAFHLQPYLPRYQTHHSAYPPCLIVLASAFPVNDPLRSFADVQIRVSTVY